MEKMNKNKGRTFYMICKAVLGVVFRLYYNPKIYGKENVPKEGSILLTGNHKHIMDQCSVILSTRRMTHWMAKREYFDDKKVAWFFKWSGCISVDRSIHDNTAKEKALSILEQGGAIGLFPEGTRNKTDAFLLPFKFGAVSMAQKTDSYLVPFGVSGDYKFRSKNLTIVIGRPFKVGKMSLEEANKRLEKEVGNLMRQGPKLRKKKK